MTESKLNTVYEMTDFAESIARSTIKPTMEQQGRTWEGQSRTSHSSEIILIQHTCQSEVQSMQEIALQ